MLNIFGRRDYDYASNAAVAQRAAANLRMAVEVAVLYCMPCWDDQAVPVPGWHIVDKQVKWDGCHVVQALCQRVGFRGPWDCKQASTLGVAFSGSGSSPRGVGSPELQSRVWLGPPGPGSRRSRLQTPSRAWPRLPNKQPTSPSQGMMQGFAQAAQATLRTSHGCHCRGGHLSTNSERDTSAAGFFNVDEDLMRTPRFSQQ